MAGEMVPNGSLFQAGLREHARCVKLCWVNPVRFSKVATWSSCTKPFQAMQLTVGVALNTKCTGQTRQALFYQASE